MGRGRERCCKGFLSREEGMGGSGQGQVLLVVIEERGRKWWVGAGVIEERRRKGGVGAGVIEERGRKWWVGAGQRIEVGSGCGARMIGGTLM